MAAGQRLRRAAVRRGDRVTDASLRAAGVNHYAGGLAGPLRVRHRSGPGATPGCRTAASPGTIAGSSAGGVNTDQGWETWSPNGTFALNYALEADRFGYIPMFPYYELFQSNRACTSCNENQKNVTKLNSPGLMRAYFANFALLMKRLGPDTYDGIKGFS
jgi:hypothetical protein